MVSNSLVIAVLALNRETQTATNFFLLNLAVADLCVALFCRYLALVYPLLSRRLLTIRKLKITIIIVWILSAVCCFPRFIIFGTVNIPMDLVYCITYISIRPHTMYGTEQD
ncbi:unnamed protein product [Medioppia subpectinata]|uniref:G-protein coupled receptors family 1 profile domain-containing protein n=1 Tax=Medioppia subpectinata TaxID=1979941 RepID=A0A7R9Q9K5_9ACAR|nr:unnamed protein product [Medioppia subpectinata]CAG2116722.1 unnamed protein product [Medioppia subpectinata]